MLVDKLAMVNLARSLAQCFKYYLPAESWNSKSLYEGKTHDKYEATNVTYDLMAPENLWHLAPIDKWPSLKSGVFRLEHNENPFKRFAINY